MIEYAILKNGEIVNVSTVDQPIKDPRTLTDRMVDGPYEVKPLDQVPLAVKQRYRYWNERP